MGENLRRRDGTYWFRRRVPDELRTRIGQCEINRSLRTNAPTLARTRAKRAWLTTEVIFQEMARNPTLIERHARVLIDLLVTESLLQSPTADELVSALLAGNGAITRQLFNAQAVDLIMELPKDQRAHMAHHMILMRHRIEAGVARNAEEVAETRAVSRDIQNGVERERADKAELALSQLKMVNDISQQVSARVAENDRARDRAGTDERSLSPLKTPGDISTEVSARVAEIAATSRVPDRGDEDLWSAATDAAIDDQEREPVTRTKLRAVRQAPLFSALQAGFIDEKSRAAEGHSPWDMQTVRQFDSTSHLFLKIVGDRPISEYTGVDVQSFRYTMLKMPSSHGKSGTRSEVRKSVPFSEEISRTDRKQAAIDSRNKFLTEGEPREASIPRLKMKTLKRHFSALSQFWVYAGRQGLVDRDKNLFIGWEYQGVSRKSKRKRLPWSAQNLNTLFSSDWFDQEQRGSDRWWIVLIAFFSGLRVEEILRLRPKNDILFKLHEDASADPVACFVIQEHQEPHAWNPKTEAGERIVPVHSVLLAAGCWIYVIRRQAPEGWKFSAFPAVR